MKIYVASSWKNQHGVEMLTLLLRNKGHEVISWIENCNKEGSASENMPFNFESWVTTPEADQSFMFDTRGATESDLFIYYAPSGKDACAELGAAWASGVKIIGLYAKGEDLGLMRKMVSKWYGSFGEITHAIELMSRIPS